MLYLSYLSGFCFHHFNVIVQNFKFWEHLSPVVEAVRNIAIKPSSNLYRSIVDRFS